MERNKHCQNAKGWGQKLRRNLSSFHMEELKRVIVKSRSCHKDELLLSIFGFVVVVVVSFL